MNLILTMVREPAPLPQESHPTVLVTRPLQGSMEFVDALRAEVASFEAVINPAFRHEAHETELPEFDAAIFTSPAGPKFAPAGFGRTAWCVGDATATAARTAGYVAISAKGDVRTLIQLILENRTKENLLYFRGEIVRGNIMAEVSDAGLKCSQATVYRTVPNKITPENQAKIQDADTFILPVFSAETVSILSTWNVPYSRSKAVAMSATVAQSLERLNCMRVFTSGQPNLASMVSKTARLIA